MLSFLIVSSTFFCIVISNKEIKIEIAKLPEDLKITGPWDVQFAPNWGAPQRLQFPELISWSDHSEQGVRYFSGKAIYHKKIRVSADMLKKDHLLLLDLGEVEVMAIVKLNGKNLGILWKKPFRLDITSVAREGENSLELTIVNLWPNRLIGDANLPEDCSWTDAGELKQYPQWLLDDKPSPTGRFTFSIIKVWSKDDVLRRSGLLGPVVLYTVANVTT